MSHYRRDKNEKTYYLLPPPDQINPPRVCVTLRIPDQSEHRQAFVGQLLELSRWWNWQRTDDKRGALVAKVWAEVFAQAIAQLDSPDREDCAEIIMDVRQSPLNPCVLEKTTDGVVWTSFADLSLCMPTLRRDPATGRYQWGTEALGFYEFPDGPWVAPSPSTAYYPPPPRLEATDVDRKCAAAANAASVYRQVYESVADDLLESIARTDIKRATEIGFILSGFLTILGISAASGPISLLSMLGIIGIAHDFYDNRLTDDDETRLKCILLDNATDDAGTVTFDWQAVWDAIDFDAPKQTNFRILMTSLGGDALNYAGSQNVTTPDCGDCAPPVCSYTDDFTGGLGTQSNLGSGYPFDPGGTHPSGVWTGSDGHFSNGMLASTPISNPADHGVLVWIDLGQDCLIKQFDFWIRTHVSANWWWAMWYQNATGGLVRYKDQGASTTPDAWGHVIDNFSPSTIRYIILNVFYPNTGGAGSNLSVDDIVITEGP